MITNDHHWSSRFIVEDCLGSSLIIESTIMIIFDGHYRRSLSFFFLKVFKALKTFKNSSQRAGCYATFLARLVRCVEFQHIPCWNSTQLTRKKFRSARTTLEVQRVNRWTSMRYFGVESHSTIRHQPTASSFRFPETQKPWNSTQ